MTEKDWLESANVWDLLGQPTCKASERKVRLFTLACCRRVWHLLTDDRSKQAVDVLERFAECRATLQELTEAGESAREAWQAAPASLPGARQAAEAVCQATSMFRYGSYSAWMVAALWASRRSAEATAKSVPWGIERRVQVGFIHDLFGDPFKPRPAIDPGWLRWNDGTVPQLARAIYDQRRWSDMGVLHDSLLDAGCDNEDMLSHAREETIHTRGCWLLDLLLNKG
jgi:hypothetical protein